MQVRSDDLRFIFRYVIFKIGEGVVNNSNDTRTYEESEILEAFTKLSYCHNSDQF